MVLFDDSVEGFTALCLLRALRAELSSVGIMPVPDDDSQGFGVHDVDLGVGLVIEPDEEPLIVLKALDIQSVALRMLLQNLRDLLPGPIEYPGDIGRAQDD